jgi:DNA-binding response OmpR family regulator
MPQCTRGPSHLIQCSPFEKLMTSSGGMHILIWTADPLLTSAFTDESKEIGIEAQSVGDSDGFSRQLSSVKYEGLVLDFDTVPAAIPVLNSVRESRPNKDAVVFAVATGANKRDRALQDGAHFLLQRPIESTEIKRTLHIAYDLMRGGSSPSSSC